MKLCILLLFMVFHSSYTLADTDKDCDFANKQTLKVYNKCTAKYIEDIESGITSRMITGMSETTLCIKEHILFLFKEILFKGDKKSYTQLKNALEKIEEGTGDLYWKIYNEHNACDNGECGSMFHPMHNLEVGLVMKQILYIVYCQIILYEDYYHDWRKITNS